MRLSPTYKREIADKLLVYWKQNHIESWNSTYSMVRKATDDLNEQPWDIHKALALLRDLGRIEYNCPNGKKGSHVIDWTPLNKPTKIDNIRSKTRKEMLVSMLKSVKSKFPTEWNDALKEVEK